MNRRSFLQPQILAGIADLDDAPVVGDMPLLRFSRRAMATTFEIAFPFGMPTAQFAAEVGLELIDDIESQLTVYRDDSEVSRLNAHAAERPVVVESTLFQLLARSLGLWHETAGAFDIAVGNLIKTWGFYRREGRVPSPAEHIDTMARTGSRYVVLDHKNQSVRFLRSGVELNFGAIGKGYALDRVAGELRTRFGIGSGLMSGGGSSVVAIGTPPGHDGWKVALKHPWRDGESLGTVSLADRALGISAATYQYFVYNGRKLGHVLDPRIGRPAEGIALAAVVAPTAAEADALSTAFFVAGTDFARRYCHSRPEVGAILLPDGTDDVISLNLTPAAFTPLPGI